MNFTIESGYLFIFFVVYVILFLRGDIIKPTIRDVAKKANVSVATVSRVINKKGYVHEETKKIVEQIIKELGFQPNQLARSLTSRHSRLIAVIVPHIGTSFYAELIEGIEYSVTSYGYKMILCNTQDSYEKELEFLNIFEQYSIEGVIIASNFLNIDKLLDLNIPIVTVDHILDETIPSITSDNIKGGMLAAKKFIESNAKNVAIFRGPSFLLTTSERTIGFLNILKENKLFCDIHDFDLVIPDAKFIKTYLESNSNVDAIFCQSDTLALITMGICQQLGKKIPEDIQIIGYDNALVTKWVNPPLTTIEQPIKYMGNEAFLTLIKLINNEELPVFHVILDVILKERGTTK